MSRVWGVKWGLHGPKAQACWFGYSIAERDPPTNGASNADGVRDAINGHVTQHIPPAINAGWYADVIVVTEKLTTAAIDGGQVPEQSSAVLNLQGQRTGTGDQLPESMCVLCSFHTNAATRSGHGRFFLPGQQFASELDPTGHWDQTGLDTIRPLAQSMIEEVHVGDALTGHTFSPVVYSRTRHNKGADLYYFSIESYTLHPEVHWLRSRAN